MELNIDVHEYYTLNQAKKHKSKTRPYPFIIAHECDKEFKNRSTNEMQTKTREYLVFDDVEQFQEVRSRFPHAHEVIWDRYVLGKQQGRLMFDFDFNEPWYGCIPKFVSPTFQQDIQDLIIKTFDTYYDDVDCSKFVFIWLISDIEIKWSKHLIVKNAYFSEDWKVQSQIFYSLMLGIAEETPTFLPPIKEGGDEIPNNKKIQCDTSKLIDTQVARANATMRMMGSSKLSGKVLKLESPSDATFYDTLVQLYRRVDVKTEQHIMEMSLKKKMLDKLFYEETTRMMLNKYYKQACKYAFIDVTDFEQNLKTRDIDGGEVTQSFKIFEHHYCNHFNIDNQMVFRVKSCVGSLINLERICGDKCMISGKYHTSENAFLTVPHEGVVYFHCRRGCDKDDKKSVRCYGPSTDL